MKKSLIDQLSIFLLKQGYTVKVMPSGAFDILARKDHIILIKALSDANSITKQAVDDMKKIAGLLDGSPLLVAEKAGPILQDNVVYSRFGLS